MQIIYEPGLERIRVNLQGIESLLREHGVREDDIDALCIHIETERSLKRREEIKRLRKVQNVEEGESQGEWMPGNVYVYIHDHMDSAIHNYTLLHELHHALTGGYQDGEDDLPHDERPSEIAADHFAREQSKRYKFITIPGELTYEVFSSKASKFVAITTTIGACLAIVAVVQHVVK